MDDWEWDRRTVVTLGLIFGAAVVVPPARAIADYIEELTMASLPSKVSAVYWTRWNSGIRLTAVPQSYNTLLLFAAAKAGQEGGVAWGMNDIAADVKTCRARGQRVVMSCGGAGNGISFSSRTVSQRFVDSIVRINTELGGTAANPVLDGVDFNTFEANATPNTPEYLWISQELRRKFGAGFGITSPPAPWNNTDKAFCKAMIAGGAMDYAAPQYYDGPGLSDPNYIVSNVNEWIRDVAGGDASKIVVGFGMENLPNYSTIDQIKDAWNRIEAAHPNIRGAFLWQHKTDSDRSWAFATQLVPLVGAETKPPTTTTPPTPGSDKKATIGASSYPLAGTNIARDADSLVVYTTTQGAISPANVWGAEAAVEGGKVKTVVDRQTTQGGGVTIPKDGYVLSGHGAAREWLLTEAQVGDAVTGDVPAPPVPEVPTGPYYAPVGSTLDQVREKHNALVAKLGL